MQFRLLFCEKCFFPCAAPFDGVSVILTSMQNSNCVPFPVMVVVFVQGRVAVVDHTEQGETGYIHHSLELL